MAVKLTKRKGFNFFRSYFDVYNELETDADKCAFMEALLERQFLGKKPNELKGMARFAYISQTNSIDSQVKGYEDKTKTRLDGSVYVKDGEEKPKTPLKEELITPTVGGEDTPTEQVEEKEEVKEEVKEESLYYKDAKEFLKDWNTARVKILKVKASNMVTLTTQENTDFNLIKDKFTKDQFKNGMRGLLKQKDMYPSNILRPKHFLSDMNIEKYIDAFINESQLYETKNKYDVKL